MPRYAAFLRGVSPMNAKMADLKACFEKLGLTEVRTVLSSGNVVFSSTARSEKNLRSMIEAGMSADLPRSFPVILRRLDHLQKLLSANPFAGFDVSPQAKRVVTFLSEPNAANLSFPMELQGARILAVQDGEVFTAYVPHEDGPVFMSLIEKTFGKNVTTRTWATVQKCVAV
ncbi:DUF1697 domain-containing protein [Diaphorobacter sp. HDW4B]|nr:DUF1697 domain-containing protein [Diaphorobacter sp. HDW4B]